MNTVKMIVDNDEGIWQNIQGENFSRKMNIHGENFRGSSFF